jgi:hypothetical protein
MKIENQVCSLEQAKRLKELGIAQQCVFKYNQNLYENAGDITEGVWTIWYNNLSCAKNQIAAFTVAELGEMIGPDTRWQTFKTRARCWCFDCEYYCTPFADFRSEAEARAAMLIILLENNHITVEGANTRLLISNENK